MPAARAAYHSLFRFQLRVRCWHADRADVRDASGLPLPPALLRYRVSEDLDPAAFLAVGEGCARHMALHSLATGVDLARSRRVLDFGCGCGRTLRWFLRDFPNVEFHGADVDQEAVDWCRKNLLGAHFARNGPRPPLPYADGYFDAIYCLSVFTHLDEVSQDLWLAEFARLLAPGGLALLSVHGAGAFDALDPQSRATLTDTGFVHRRTSKLNGIVPDWYQTTWHSEQYIVGRVSAHFDNVVYRDVPDGMQAFVLGRGRNYCLARKDFTSTVSPL
jgi:SAM-dependent methyltransferase